MEKSTLINDIVASSVPFIDIKDFSHLIKSCKDKKIVMIGEASHGTREFYEWRNLISKELIQHHGFDFIAVEGDWPACERINDFVTRQTANDSIVALQQFSRWPSWMWANDEIVKFMDWLREWNLDSPKRSGFHGLDIYSLFESIDDVILTLEVMNPELASVVKKHYSCFDTFNRNEMAYAGSLFHSWKGCEGPVTEALVKILKAKIVNPYSHFNLKQNAKIIQNAEAYYRSMIFANGNISWNVRDEHMLETLVSLLHHYGPESKAIVWAHNSHIGDYRATDMLLKGEVNLGGLTRKSFGEENVSLIGFSTYQGEVTASHAWDGEILRMKVPPASKGSIEDILNSSVPMVGHKDFYLDLRLIPESSSLQQFIGHRAIGVVYDPDRERRNYVPTCLPKRYDFLAFIQETHALRPLGIFSQIGQFPETWPTGDVP